MSGNEGTQAPRCPECDTQLVLIDNKPPKKCDKCGFVLEGYANFKRWIKAIEKEEETEKKEKEKKEKEKREAEGTSFFDSLRNA